jgi:predicted Zn-dependent peptidase
MADRPMTAQELHLAKAQGLREIELGNQSASDIAESWLGYAEEDLSLNRIFDIARAYERLEAHDVQAAFRKHIDTGRLSTFVLGKPVTQ